MTPLPWLTVLGVGADGPGGLGLCERAILDGAEVVVGGARHLAALGEEDRRPRVAWRSPIADTLGEIRSHEGRRVVVLATGDPSWFGVGRLLLRHLPPGSVRIVPHVSAFQLAAAQLGWALEDVLTLSLHGRPLDRLRRHLAPDRRVLALSTDGGTPAAVAALLREAGYGPSRVWVLERMGDGEAERVVALDARGLGADRRFADLNTLALELEAEPGAPVMPLATGLPDEAFDHDGQLTKREIRAVTLAALAPRRGELLWDVGAGAGGVAIDWLRVDPSLRAVAVERDGPRAERLLANATRHGVGPELELTVGEAPACLGGLPVPDAVFVGGGLGEPGLIEACWERLRPGGRLVANAVTLAGEAALLAFRARNGGGLLRIALGRAAPLGGETAWRPALPVTQLVVEKPCVAES